MQNLTTRTIVAGGFAILGVGAAAWVVAGPAIERWWKAPKARPIEHATVETDLAAPPIHHIHI